MQSYVHVCEEIRFVCFESDAIELPDTFTASFLSLCVCVCVILQCECVVSYVVVKNTFPSCCFAMSKMALNGARNSRLSQNELAF